MIGTVLVWLLQIASTIYCGTVISFAILFLAFPASTGRPRHELTRVYRSMGPILGLSMGAMVFAIVAGRFWETGDFVFAWSTTAEQLDLATHVSFLLLWFSSFVLEIWTMHDLRMTVDDDTNQVTDQSAFDACFERTRTHIWVNVVLILTWQTLRVIGA